jgi:transcriptional regulator with XRE-family HTH domain
MAEKNVDYQEIHSEIGKRIRKQRRLIGLTQNQVAEALAVTFQQIQKYEAGLCSISCGRLVKIAEVLSVTPAELITPQEDFPDLNNDASLDADMSRLWANFAAIKSPAARRAILKYLLHMQDEGGPADMPPGAPALKSALAQGARR